MLLNVGKRGSMKEPKIKTYTSFDLRPASNYLKVPSSSFGITENYGTHLMDYLISKYKEVYVTLFMKNKPVTSSGSVKGEMRFVNFKAHSYSYFSGPYSGKSYVYSAGIEKLNDAGTIEYNKASEPYDMDDSMSGCFGDAFSLDNTPQILFYPLTLLSAFSWDEETRQHGANDFGIVTLTVIDKE